MNISNYSQVKYRNKTHISPISFSSTVLKQIIIISEIGWYLNDCPEPKDIFLKNILIKLKGLHCDIDEHLLDDLIESKDIISKFNNFFKTLSIMT
jgi:hypothetical protein